MQKGAAIYTDPTHLELFSLAVNEIVKTPLGITGTVCGVKYATAEQAATMSGGKVTSNASISHSTISGTYCLPLSIALSHGNNPITSECEGLGEV